MSKFFLSIQSITRAFEALKELSVNNESVLHIFFILKALGYTEKEHLSDGKIGNDSHIPAHHLSYLFNDSEEVPGNYDFINPFKMGDWGSQPSELMKKWCRSRIKNNIEGGATTWRSIINYNQNEKTIKFTYDYLPRLTDLTLQADTKINISAFSIWIMRFNSFEEKATASQLIDGMSKYFKLTEREIAQLFKTSGMIIPEFVNSEFEAVKIRQLLPIPPGTTNWVTTTPKQPELDIENTSSINRSIPMPMTQNLDSTKVSKLIEQHKQVILSGPPGTSKSFLCEKISKGYDFVKKIQFHPEYSYNQFVGGYMVRKDIVVYEKGIMLDLISLAEKQNEKKHLLIIEEINRANVSQVFGEMTQCLDRNYKISLKIDETEEVVSIPKNLHIIATMNSTDRSVGSVDLAIKRRFIHIYCPPEPNILIDLCSVSSEITPTDVIVKINENLLKNMDNRDMAIGHAFFLEQDFYSETSKKYEIDFEEIEIIFNYKILPLLEDFCYRDDDKLLSIVGEDLSKRLSGDDFILALKALINDPQ